jgi:hypothetical protein
VVWTSEIAADFWGRYDPIIWGNTEELMQNSGRAALPGPPNPFAVSRGFSP